MQRGTIVTHCEKDKDIYMCIYIYMERNINIDVHFDNFLIFLYNSVDSDVVSKDRNRCMYISPTHLV